VFPFQPARAHAEVDPAAAHRVHLSDHDGQRAGQPEGRGVDQGADPDPGGLPSQPGQRDPGVGGAGKAQVGAHRLVVVGAQEALEAERLRVPGQPQLVVIGGAAMRLDEERNAHTPSRIRLRPGPIHRDRRVER
jgi:hypothetical protein